MNRSDKHTGRVIVELQSVTSQNLKKGVELVADLHCVFDTRDAYCISHLNRNLLNNSNHHHHHPLLRLILSLPSLARTRAPRRFCCIFFCPGGRLLQD